MGTVAQLSQLGFSPIQCLHLGIDGVDIAQGGWVPATLISTNFDVTVLAGTYISATSFSVPGDVTGYVQAGDKIKFTQPGGVKYGDILSVSFGSSVTTITLFANDGYSVANQEITSIYFSKHEKPHGFPSVFSYTTTLGAPTGSTNTPVRLITNFKVNGGLIKLWLSCGLNLTTATAAYLSFTIPVAGFNGADFQWFGTASIVNAGTREANGIFFINTTGTTGRVYRSAAAAWPIGNGHAWNGELEYRWI